MIGTNTPASSRDEPDEPVWSVILDGRPTQMTQSQIESAKASGEIDLILDLTTQMLSGWLYRDGMRTPEWVELRLGYKPVRVLYAAMYRLRPFGDLFMARIDPGDAELSRRDLSGYVCQTTKIIQKGGTKGPYLFRINGASGVSSTGKAYVLSREHRYLVIEYRA